MNKLTLRFILLIALITAPLQAVMARDLRHRRC